MMKLPASLCLAILAILTAGNIADAADSTAPCYSMFFERPLASAVECSFLGGVPAVYQVATVPREDFVHICDCIEIGGGQKDCFYDAGTHAPVSPNNPHYEHADGGCEWQDGVASLETCQCNAISPVCCNP